MLTQRPSLLIRLLALALLLAVAGAAAAGVLPEDRADALYHRYEGGGMTIHGPSVLVRKKFLKDFSASANYYVDMVSSASIDVITTASPYTEQRDEFSLGLDYLRGDGIWSLTYTNSEESDYSANTYSFGIAHDVFGGLTTINLGYSFAQDEVRRNGDPTFSEEIKRQNYRVAVTQILTKKSILAVSFETISDEGFLNNPYRSVRYLDPNSAIGYSYESEVYPRTRTSNALAIRTRYHMPWTASMFGEVKFFDDTWGISSKMLEIGYTHPWVPWIFDLRLRYYTQDGADFYADLFPAPQSQNFMARDKELSTFTSMGLRVAASYEFLQSPGWKFFDRGTLNISIDRMYFDYEDFRNLTVTGVPPGTEPLYNFDANVIQLYVSLWL